MWPTRGAARGPRKRRRVWAVGEQATSQAGGTQGSSATCGLRRLPADCRRRRVGVWRLHLDVRGVCAAGNRSLAVEAYARLGSSRWPSEAYVGRGVSTDVCRCEGTEARGLLESCRRSAVRGPGCRAMRHVPTAAVALAALYRAACNVQDDTGPALCYRISPKQPQCCIASRRVNTAGGPSCSVRDAQVAGSTGQTIPYFLSVLCR